MIVATTKKQLAEALASARAAGRTPVGLVPTMGALHSGHASLVRRSVGENKTTVVSVFVNPTQFNNPTDLATYPRTLEADCQLLGQMGADIVFAPSAEEMYPEPDTRRFSYPPVDTVMEGPRRPGHFNGVCQVVSKLFMAVQPDVAYFGEKDFQQIAVIRAMVRAEHFPLEVRACPIVRAESGLALSSRNALLTPHERDVATRIYRTLCQSRERMSQTSVGEVRSWVVSQINAEPLLQVEYFEIVDGTSLQPVASWAESDDIVGCITVYCGPKPVRLIDNIRYR